MLDNTHSVPWKIHAKFQSSLSFDKLMLAKQLPASVAIEKPHPMWLVMLPQLLGDHTPNFGLIYT